MTTVMRGSDNFDTAENGRVLQVVAVNGRSSDWSTTSSTLVQVDDSSISITPTSSSSRIYVTWQLAPHITAAVSTHAVIVGYRNSTAIGVVHGKRDYTSTGTIYIDKTAQGSVFDHPNTTSAVTYSLYAATSAGTFVAHRTWNSALVTNEPIMRIIAMEIEAGTSWS
tara:strand:+ start:92 stop:592 length:501 start_codon:yes stop_codon:yes gene_type:complete